MNSVWQLTTSRPDFTTLTGDISTDVLIIGGGIAGILCAHALCERGVDYALVEADRICSGITADTTAKVTYQHGLIYDRIIKTYGREYAEMYLAAGRDALKEYRKLSEQIDCELEEKSSYVYSLSDTRKIEQELAALDKLGADAKLVKKLCLPLDTVGAVRIDRQAQLNPLKLLYGISRQLNIYESTKVLELADGLAITNRGKIRAKKIIIATHFPMLNKHGMYFLKLYQHRSYVLALENAADVDGMYIDESGRGLSFRNHGSLLLLGGGSHRTGKRGGGYSELARFASNNYKQSREICRFATQDCMTLDGIPYIGRYSSKTENLYVATGFNKWGMTSAMSAALILADMVEGKRKDYAPVFSPQRSILHPQLLVNVAESLLNILTPTVPRCPHMGCALKYNKEEHTWDCPCHGSRFTESGKLIDNPATDDKKM